MAACELALAPESLEDYRTRIDANAKRNGRPNGKLASNRVIKDARGERLESDLGVPPERGRLLAGGERSNRRQPATLHVHPQRRGFRLCEGSPRLRRDHHGDQVLTTRTRVPT